MDLKISGAAMANNNNTAKKQVNTTQKKVDPANDGVASLKKFIDIEKEQAIIESMKRVKIMRNIIMEQPQDNSKYPQEYIMTFIEDEKSRLNLRPLTSKEQDRIIANMGKSVKGAPMVKEVLALIDQVVQMGKRLVTK
ncbi:MAG: hypothetical protein WC838_06360 [Candidatus Margulisiibacteriota bacterium]|jgi:glucosamine 6-phosphate synthetase-like amidotransferase/phosphosugar isomerase protein